MTRAPQIRIGDVHLPLADFAVARTGILGITKSGKTYAAKGIAEQLLEHGLPIIVFDAIGVWRYLKVKGEGARAKGYPIVVAGGAQPDLPLTPASAPEIVRAAIRENISVVIDLYDPKLSKADWRRIVQASCRTLLYENTSPRMVFLEEASEYAPQRIIDGETYAEVEKLTRMGGNVRVGITFINQRAQELNKAVLELCDNLVLLRQRGSHAIEALAKWLDKVSPSTAKEIATALPHMTQGDCWVWTEDAEHPVRTRTRELRSLHLDRRVAAPASVVQRTVDTGEFVTRLSGELTTLLEQAKANDPKELQKRIRELEKQLEVKTQEKDGAVDREVEVSVFTEEDRQVIARCGELCAESIDRLDTVTEEIDTALKFHAGRIAAVKEEAMTALRLAQAKTRAPSTPPHRPVSSGGRGDNLKALARVAAPPSGELDTPLQRIVDTVAMLDVRGIPKDRDVVARWMGLHPNGGSYGTNLGQLRSRGYLEGFELTGKGQQAARAMKTGVDGILEGRGSRSEPLLDPPKRRIVELCLAHPQKAWTRETLAEELGLHPNGGSYGTNLGRLRTMGILTARGPIKLTEAVFK